MGSFFSPLAKYVGIDIGSSMTRVFTDGRGIVLAEPSVVATDAKVENIIAVGNDAELLLSKSKDMVEPLTPFHNGVISDYRVTRTMLQHFMKKSIGKSFVRGRVMVAVPGGITEVEQRAMTDALMQIGSREAYLVSSAVMAALGEDLPVFEPVGSLIAEIGASTTDIVAISMGGIVKEKSLRIGGDQMNRLIANYVRESFNMMVSSRDIESIKLNLATAMPPEAGEDDQYTLRGRDSSNGLEKTITLRRSEIYGILAETISKIIEGLRSILEELPPEICADVLRSGMVLTGGVANLKGLKDRVHQELGVRVIIPKEPELSAVKGFGRAFREKERMKRLFLSSKNRRGKK